MNRHVITLIGFIFLISSCKSDSGSPESLDSSPAGAAPDLVQFNEAGTGTHETALEIAKAFFDEDGIADTCEAIREAPLRSAADIGAMRKARDELRVLLEEHTDKVATLALRAHDMETSRRAFLDRQSKNFPLETSPSERYGRIRQPLVLETLAVATLSIGAYRFLKGFAELAKNTERMVHTTANGDEQSREAVIDILKKNGVDVADDASSSDIIDAFDSQPRAQRRTITSQVEAWNESSFSSPDSAVSDAVQERFEEAREDIPDIANEGGEFAVAQTVTLVQSVTGGVGSIQGGVPGAVADLTLTATEMNPTDIAQRNVTVYVTAGDKEDLPTETTPTSPSEALERIERASKDPSDVNPKDIEDAAVALMQELADALRSQFGPSVKLAQKIALLGGTLEDVPQAGTATVQSASLPVPHFANGEICEVVVVREGRLPQEVGGHQLGPDNAIALTGPPLLGTISVETTPKSAASEESQRFDVTATVTRVPFSTSLHCQGTNVSCSPAASSIAQDSAVTFSVEVFGTAQLRLVRHDTGESYSLVLKAQKPDTEPQTDSDTPPSDLDPELFGTWLFSSDDGDYFWRFNSDGTCVQGILGDEVEWKWTIESGQLKLFVDNGIPAYKQYKIEGNLLYFWVDSVEVWSSPFTKQ